MIHWPLFFLSFAFPLLCGMPAAVLLLKNHRVSPGLLMGISYGLGLGSLSVWMMILKWLGVPFHVWTVSLPPLLLWIPCLRYRRGFTFADTAAAPPPDGKWLRRLTGLLVAITVFLVFAYHTQLPVIGWDSLATASLNAKVLYHTAGTVPLSHLVHADYPLLVPLTQCWLAIVHGGWNEYGVKYAFPWIFCAFLLLQFHWMRAKAGVNAATLSVLLLLSAYTVGVMALLDYREIFLMYFASGAFFFLVSWQDAPDETAAAAWLRLASVFAALMLFTKSEGLIYLAAQTMLVAGVLLIRRTAMREAIWEVIRFLSFPVFMLVALKSVHWMHGITSVPLTLPERILSLERFASVFSAFLKMTVFSMNWNITWMLLPIALLVFRRERTASVKFLEAGVALCLCGYFFGAMTTNIFFTVTAGPAQALDFPRLLLHFFPLVTVILALLVYRDDTRST